MQPGIGLSANPTLPKTASPLASGLTLTPTPSATIKAPGITFTPSSVTSQAVRTPSVPAAAPTSSPAATPATAANNPPQPVAPAATNERTLPNGARATVDQGGNLTSFTPGFSIDTSGAVPSTAFGAATSSPTATRSKYEDAARALSEASGYSPGYVGALEAKQAVDTRGAELKSNYYTGNDLPGDTLGFAGGFTTREQALNDIAGLRAEQRLNVETLLRNGSIEAAKALVEAYKPTSVAPGSSLVSPTDGSTLYGGAGAYSDYQAQQTYFNLAQQFPDAEIPAYDPKLSAQQNLQIAQEAAAKSPSFQSRNLIQVQLPGGGISFVNKNQIVTNPDGTTTFISPEQGAKADAYKKVIADNQSALSQTKAAIETADANFPILLDAAKKAGVNNNAPLANQIQQAVSRKVVDSAALATLNTMVPSLQAEYARILNRGGGEVTDSERRTSAALIDGSYSLTQLQAVYNTIKKEGANVIAGYQSAINDAAHGLSTVYGAPGAPTSSNGSDTAQIGNAKFQLVNGKWQVVK